jgi:hypothetical protein
MTSNYLMHTPARAFHRAFMKKVAKQSLVLFPSMDSVYLRNHLFNYCFLLQLTGKVYNLHIETGMRRAPSRQQSNP